MAITKSMIFLSILVICSLAFSSAISLKVKTKQYYDPTNLFNTASLSDPLTTLTTTSDTETGLCGAKKAQETYTKRTPASSSDPL